MHLSLVVLHLAGAVMLLLWAVRMVRTGVERAAGSNLRDALRGARAGRIQAAFAGGTLAMLLQSSTAVAMLAAGFAASGILPVATGLAALLGADVGSALVVQVLSFDLSWLMPVLLVVGPVLFLKFEGRMVKQAGRILLGIALILLSLRLIGEATEPLRHSTFLPIAVGYLRGDFITAFALAAGFAWLIHSSVAAILLFAAFAAQGMLPVEVGIAFVLGANLGAGAISVWLTRNEPAIARRIPVGNMCFRAIAAISALFAYQISPFSLDLLGASEARQLINLHLAFNAVLLVVSLPIVAFAANLMERIVRDDAVREEKDPASVRVSALDPAVVGQPNLALASATRELLRMGETVEQMLRPVMDVFESGNPEQVARICALDREVNQAHTGIKLFIAKVNRGELSEEEAQRGIELTDFAINLEHIGDIIAKNLMRLVNDKSESGLSFSREGWKEMNALHARVTANMQLALNVLVSEDLESARQLVREKETMRKLERDSHQRHLARLQSGREESIATSDIHLEVVRGLKEINSLLVTVAYPLLSQSGDLLESRLAKSA